MNNIRIELTIALADGGNTAREIIEMYGTQIIDDIAETAWNECDCDDQLLKQKFTDLKLDQWSVKHRSGGSFNITAVMKASAENAGFVRRVIEEYMNGFADCISAAENGIYSRTGVRTGFNPNPLEWEVDVK